MWLLGLICAGFHPAWAIDPGTAVGTVEVNGGVIILKHAFAHLQQQPDGSREMRVALMACSISQDDIAGRSPSLLSGQARCASGLLLRFDPHKRKSRVLTVIGSSEGAGKTIVWRRWAMNPQRVDGVIEIPRQRIGKGNTLESLDPLQFSAPLFTGR